METTENSNEPIENTDSVENPDKIEIARLSSIITNQTNEISELNTRLTASQQHYESIINRLKDENTKEKQSNVMRYAQAEKAKLDSDKRCELFNAKYGDLLKEKESLQTKLAELKLMNTKLQQGYESKLSELTTMKRESDKIKELNQSIDATLKSTLNHLKGESLQLKEQKELNEKLKKDLNDLQEANAQLNSQCQQLTETIQSIPTDDERTQTFETLSSEHNALKSKLDNVQEENNLLREKLKSADEDRVALENVIENFRQNALKEKESTKKLYEDLLAARQQDSVEISRLKQIESLHNQTLADNADLRQLLEKEHEYLDLTQKLTEKNSILQSDYEQIQNLYKQTSDELENLKKTNEENSNEISKFETTEKSLKIQFNELNDKYQKLNKSYEESVKQYEDSLVEIQTLKKKHQANTKDLIKQLQQLQKQKTPTPPSTVNNDDQSPVLLTTKYFFLTTTTRREKRTNSFILSSQSKTIPTKENLGDNTSSRGSPTGSNYSLNEMTPPVSIPDQPPPMSHSHIDDEPEVLVNIVDIDRQKLIEKLVKQQKLLVKRKEKIEFLNDHIQLLTQDLQNKRKIIQSYAMNEDSFMYTSSESDSVKQQLANKSRNHSSSLMATLYSRANNHHQSTTTTQKYFDQSSPMTLETALDVMGKLQSVLEDTLLKNLTLKDNVDTLSQEVEKLSKRTIK